ncbi:hypothetical protein F5J12DRAFT_826633 [Pisolithus orientalis]|uniref:uncharacterized protein n=1 Tax=Pisolithus orientalis TaxID=936130 RepID=UPI002223FFFC|nr:uncharacterized protein F5J12DRAFT_826633 [Pisolithus orientalis]KAI6008098.1 hypothetical protein F5J12DRAFT_826633 [Pisolithus orientalis]
MPQLPPTLKGYDNQPGIVSAYNIILGLEWRILREIDSEKDKLDKKTNTLDSLEKKLMRCRILGFLFHHFPGLQLNGRFTTEIITINGDDEKLLELGEQFYQLLVKLFSANKGRTPTPTSHPSRPSFDQSVKEMKARLNGPPPNHQMAKRLALARDGYRCVITKVYDWSYVKDNTELLGSIRTDGGRMGVTECAHTFPESINANTTSGSNKEHYAASVWAVLDRFGYGHLQQELNGIGINRLENVMTMDLTLHKLFDSLQIWFCETDVPNVYELDSVEDLLLRDIPRSVTFSTTDPELSLPSSTYLAIHAACAKVAHLSGAGEHILKTFRDMGDMGVLAEDGGSGELLCQALQSQGAPISV